MNKEYIIYKLIKTLYVYNYLSSKIIYENIMKIAVNNKKYKNKLQFGSKAEISLRVLYYNKKIKEDF